MTTSGSSAVELGPHRRGEEGRRQQDHRGAQPGGERDAADEVREPGAGRSDDRPTAGTGRQPERGQVPVGTTDALHGRPGQELRHRAEDAVADGARAARDDDAFGVEVLEGRTGRRREHVPIGEEECSAGVRRCGPCGDGVGEAVAGDEVDHPGGVQAGRRRSQRGGVVPVVAGRHLDGWRMVRQAGHDVRGDGVRSTDDDDASRPEADQRSCARLGERGRAHEHDGCVVRGGEDASDHRVRVGLPTRDEHDLRFAPPGGDLGRGLVSIRTCDAVAGEQDGLEGPETARSAAHEEPTAVVDDLGGDVVLARGVAPEQPDPVVGTAGDLRCIHRHADLDRVEADVVGVDPDRHPGRRHPALGVRPIPVRQDETGGGGQRARCRPG